MGGKLQSLVAESHQLLYVFCCNRLSQVPFKKTFENALFHMIGDHTMPNAHNTSIPLAVPDCRICLKLLILHVLKVTYFNSAIRSLHRDLLSRN